MASVGRLSIEVDVNTSAAARGLDNLDNSIRDVDDSAGDLKQRFLELAASIGAGAFVSKLVAVQRQFDVLNASLITMTGSAADAAAEMEWIKKFAATTPYDLAQVVGAFTKLKSLGLDPSEAALRSYGNTAAAMGKDLSQFIEAVADATTGEFERLKEFGIKSSAEGDKVRFTFQGLTTEIGNNADKITDYLRKIGDVNFASASSERAKTLDGAISNLADSWDGLFLAISKAGVGDAIKSQVETASSALASLSAAIENNKETLGILLSATAGAGLAASLPRIAAGLVAVRGAFAAMAATAAANPAVLALLVGGAVIGGMAGYDNRVRSTKELRSEIDKLTAARERLIDAEGVTANTSGYDAQIAKLKQALEVAKQLELANVPSLLTNQSPAESRRLGMSAPTAATSIATPDKKGDKKIAESVFADGDPVQQALQDRLDAWVVRNQEAQDEVYQQWLDGIAKRAELIRAGLQTTEESETRARQEQQLIDLEDALTLGLVTEQDYMLQRQELEAQHMDELARIRDSGEKRLQDITKMSWQQQSSFVIGKMAEMTAGLASSSRAAFNINKAAAIAQAIMDTQAGAARALKDYPAPWSYAVAGATYAQGMARVSAIKSQSFGGTGGMSSGGAATSVPTMSPAATNTASGGQVITIQGVGTGDLFSGDAVRSLIEKLADAQRNGARVVIA